MGNVNWFSKKNKVITPDELGKVCAQLTFTDWPEDLSRIITLCKLGDIEGTKSKHFEIETAILNMFISLFAVSHNDRLNLSQTELHAFLNSFHQAAEDLLGKLDWDKEMLGIWNTNRGARCDQYTHCIEEDGSPASPKLGFAYIRNAIPAYETKEGNLIIPGTTVSFYVGYRLVGLTKFLLNEFSLH